MDKPMIDSRGHRRTASLFKEVSQDSNLEPVYTMKDHAVSGLPSAYQIYMAATDEYDAAMTLVGSMVHWRKLLACQWFMKGSTEDGFTGLEDWRKDMDLRDASYAKRIAREGVAGGNLKAASLLLDIAAGKKTRQETKSSAKATPRRGSPNSPVVDISSIAKRIKPE